MKMTKQQENAVLHRGSTLLVSAGAGSGKTSTLSKRIISRISDPEDKAEINDFLIVTFTNASARDLSEKIERAVSECVAKDLSNKKVFRQLAKIKYANISTISSFCLGVVKKHFQLLGLPAKLRVCDEAEAVLLKNRAITSVIEEKYANEKEDSIFFELVELFSGSKSDEHFVELIDKLHRKIYSYPDPCEWKSTAISKYDEIINCSDYLSTEYGKTGLLKTVDAANELRESLQYALKRMENIPEMLPYVTSFMQDIENISSVLSHTGERYDNVREHVLSYSKTRLGSCKYDESFRKEIQATREIPYKKFDTLRKAFFGAEQEKIKLAANDCKKLISALFDLAEDVDNTYSDEKKSRGIIDFSDAERYAYKLFVSKYDSVSDTLEPSDIAKKYRDSFAEIYIDEYQDINPIQDMIFRSITSYDENGHEKNRFMVGDIKQSIYRFRGARPNLFAGYLEKFSALDIEDESEKKEFLSDNFRCSEPVVDFTNLIFDRIMNSAYKSEDRLVYSRREAVKISNPCEICVFEDVEEPDEFYEAEIKATANRILSIVNDENAVTSEGRRITFGDIAVLMPSPKKTAERYAKYFESCGIPTYSEITENFFTTSEILLCLCLLNTIDNSHRDIYVAGAMRSEIFGFTDDELLSLRRFYPSVATKEQPLWMCAKAISESDIDDTELKEKCAFFVSTIEKFKKSAIGTPSDKFLLQLFAELHLMNVVSEASFNRYTESASLRRENLMILYNLARNFEKTSFRGLSAFLEFLTDRADKPDSVHAAVSSDESSAVRIMSIHHSKGLEFPVCIICGISKQFNRNDEREKLIISDDMGVAFKLRDLDSLTSSDSGTGMVSYDTPFRNALKEAESGHLLAEQKRVFYVGITRAKDRLILMLKKPDEPELAEYYTKSISYSLSYIERANGFYDWIYGTVCAYDKASVLYENTGICRERLFTDEKNCFTVTKANTDFSYSSKKKEVAVSDRSIDMIADEIKQRLEYKYPYRALSAIRSKISITDIKNGKFLIDDSVFDAKNVSLEKPMFLSSVGYTSAEAGTAMHCFMQYADFLRCENDILAEARRLVESGYITGEQMDMLDIAKLESFFKSNLYSEIRNAKRVFRESAFTLNLPVWELYESDDKAFDGETLLVQGKIDCYFEDINGGYRIIDFKTDKVTDASILADRYMLQLLYYKKAVKEITLSDNVSAVIYSFHTGETVEIK